MTLRLYDTASRRVVDLVPGTPDRVGIYLCGLTVQAGPHIGHLRSGVNYDVLRRWLLRSGYQVTLVRNLTDIDDKLLANAAATGAPFWAIAYANELTLAAAYRALRVLPPSYEPRATGHIPDMHELIGALVARGHAYPAVDGPDGDVYFDVGSYPDYGALSGQRPAEVQPSEDGDPRGKRDPRDFALWKGAKPDEPADAHWPSPWGLGRPGWHIECSAMARRYLGDEFDIHGGGLDLIFPHHENELAQSRAAGLGFARYWVHHGMLNLSETKMSKSLGNVLDLDAVTAMGIRPEELRYYLVAPHYRSRIDYSDGALREAAVAYRRLEGFVQRASERVGSGALAPGQLGPVCAEFTAAMDDDLNTPQALASLHDVLHEGNTAYADGNDSVLRGTLGSVRAMLDVLGLDPLDPARPAAAAGDGAARALREVVDALVVLALEQREAARDRKDYASADAVRDRLKQAGIVVEDTARGPRWTIDGG